MLAVRRGLSWLLITGGRRQIAVGLLVVVYATVFGFHLLWPVEIVTILDEERTVKDLLATLLSGDILLISIVVSINSLVLSQELTSIGEQHERVVESWDFRERSEEIIGDVSPATPTQFLRQVASFLEDEVQTLDAELDGSRPDVDDDDTVAFVEDLDAYLRDVVGMLRTSRSGWFKPELFAPAFDPAAELDQARQLRRSGADAPDNVARSADRLVDALQYFASAREYFKTVYYKREFSRLSRDLLYSGLPAILVVSYVLLALNAETFPGTTLGVNNLFLFFSLAYTVALSPFLILTGYVLRAAIIAESTMIPGGFLLE